jgi:Protein of unknown function (DUF2752)
VGSQGRTVAPGVCRGGDLLPYAGRVTVPVHDPAPPEPLPAAAGRTGAEPDADGTRPAPTGTAAPRWRTPLLAGVAAACGCVAIAVVDPTDSGVPICWSQAVFGVDCPLCGGLRATNSLMRGDLLAAADHNVFVAVGLPLVAVVWIAWVAAQLLGRPFRLPRVPRPVIAVLAVAVVTFTVARNYTSPGWIDWLGSSSYG